MSDKMIVTDSEREVSPKDGDLPIEQRATGFISSEEGQKAARAFVSTVSSHIKKQDEALISALKCHNQALENYGKLADDPKCSPSCKEKLGEYTERTGKRAHEEYIVSKLTNGVRWLVLGYVITQVARGLISTFFSSRRD